MLRNGTTIMCEIMMKRMIYITGVVHASYMTTISCQGANNQGSKFISISQILVISGVTARKKIYELPYYTNTCAM
jgi:hypothetical protein